MNDNPGKRSTIKHLSRLALLTALALMIFMLELQLPEFGFVPGVKPGFANIVLLYTVYTMGFKDALIVNVARVAAAALLTGRMTAALYGFAGALLACAVLFIFRKYISSAPIWAASSFAALGHNVAQLAVAAVLTGTVEVFAVLPLLAVAGLIAGVFTGIAAEQLIKRIDITRL